MPSGAELAQIWEATTLLFMCIAASKHIKTLFWV